MEIYVNGAPREVPSEYTAAQLIEEMGLAGRRIAVELNLEILPRSVYPAQRLCPGDRVEIVQAIGGG